MIGFVYDFYKTKAADLMPSSLLEKLANLKNLDISQPAKQTELSILISQFYTGLSDDNRLKTQTELSNRLSSYVKEHNRDLEMTAIAKIDLNDFKIVATGQIPGTVLNQFSLDEYQNNLRVATTITSNLMGISAESFSDVYVLDDQLKISGKVTDLGRKERIYSVRFINNRGYVVTFRQTDPFYVLDLTDSKNPKLAGELKIPGFSSYLHPLTDKIILGVGQDDGKVKLTTFDISNPASPAEINTYQLDDYWSEVQSNHHAFLQDDKHRIFFLPGGKGGYIFSYDQNLQLVKAVSDYQAKRSIFINDYLYVITENKIGVFNETDWNQVNQLDI
jgi:uncharacterized secreted protein with C-terminal beta-propeller domain